MAQAQPQETKKNKNAAAAQQQTQQSVESAPAVTETGGGWDPTQGAPVPEGFERRAGDLVGYWESTSYNEDMTVKKEGSPPVSFTPLHVTMQDNKEDERNASILIHCRLEHDALLRSAEKDEGYRVYPKGSLFGIWYKAGMKQLSDMGGVKVWMGNDGCKRIKNRKQPMGLFDVRDSGGGERLQCTDDRRDKSLPAALRRKKFEAEQGEGDVDPNDDFIPF